MPLLSFTVPAEYFNAAHDILRMLCIQVVVQFLFNVAHPSENPFFSLIFFQTISFVLIGVAFYWLVMQYLVRFTTVDDKNDDNTDKNDDNTDKNDDNTDKNSYNPALYTPEMDALRM